jgi:hypothetical protein
MLEEKEWRISWIRVESLWSSVVEVGGMADACSAHRSNEKLEKLRACNYLEVTF